MCRQCHLVLHSLLGNYELIGATRIARRVVDCEARANEFGPLQLAELRSLHTKTLEALRASQPSAEPLSPSHPPSTPPSTPPPHAHQLFVAAIDDTEFARCVSQTVLFPLLSADTQLSKVLGATRLEQISFVDFALGRVDGSMHPLPPPYRQADIVLLDENITLHDMPHLRGSELARQLRERGFVGVICVISALESETLMSQHVDSVYSKSFDPGVLTTTLLQLHETRKSASAESRSASFKQQQREQLLVDLTHFQGLPTESLYALLAQVYDKATDAGAMSLYTKLKQLEDRFESGEDIRDISHAIKGTATTAGACKLAMQLSEYSHNGAQQPNAQGIASLWSTLEATRLELMASGVLLPVELN